MLFPYYLYIGFITLRVREGFVPFENNNDNVDDQSHHQRAMKGKLKEVKLKGTSGYFWARSKELIWLQIGSARIQSVRDETSDHELTPDRTPTIGDNLSSSVLMPERLRAVP
jgi:hypothetical protein